MSDWQFAFIVTLIIGVYSNQLLDECKRVDPRATGVMRSLAVGIVLLFTLAMAGLVATIYAAVRAW